MSEKDRGPVIELSSPSRVPNAVQRISAVWIRHFKVYVSHAGNYFPPIFEPLIIVLACTYGLASYMDGRFDGLSYVEYIIPALAANIAMWTASFECTFESFIRMHYEGIYEPMISTPVNVYEALLGEIAFASTKSFFFSAVLILEMYALGELDSSFGFVIPFVGFITGGMFGGMGLLVVAYVKSMHTLNFYISGVIVPMTFLSGGFFPLSPSVLSELLSLCMPISHVINLMRAIYVGDFSGHFFLELLLVVGLCALFVFLGVRTMARSILR